MIPFKIGIEYERDSLLEFVGSIQRQSGIIWGDKDESVVIVTSGGRHGKRVGYGDQKYPDGSWRYIGQGEKGDQDPYKFSNSLLTNRERSVFFFSTREPNAQEVRERGNHRKLYLFEGIYSVLSWSFRTPKEGKREGDKLVQYHLIPTSNVYSGIVSIPINKTPYKDLGKLRTKLSINTKAAPKGISLTEYRKRSNQVKEYALVRSDGKCELCEKEAPFLNSSNLPYLEVHHIHSLADDGPDEPENVAALCPNCHREAHFGKNKEKLRLSLADKISMLETSLTKNSS